MELLVVRHPDFTLSIQNDNFVKIWRMAQRNIGSENLMSTWKWTHDDTEVSLIGLEGEKSIKNGDEAPAVFFDNVDYPVWVDFNQPVKAAKLSLPGKIQKERGSYARESSSFRERSNTLSAFINYGNEIGRSYIRITYILPNNEKREWSIEFDVLSIKLNYHEHWRTILKDIEREYRMLSLDFMRRTFHSFNPGASNDSHDIIWWNIFNKLQKQFIKAARSIIEKPRHRLRDIPEYRRAEQIHHFTSRLEEEFAEHRNEDNHLYRTMLPSNSNDTLENRFLLHALRGISSRFSKLFTRIKQTTLPSPEMLEEMESTERELKRLSRHPFFRTVGPFKGFSQESQILQKASGYSQIYRSWIILNKGYSLEEGLYNLETKDIATLYEIWCYIQVKNIVEKHLGEDTVIENRNRVEMGPLFSYSLSKGQKSSIVFRKDDITLAELIYNPQETSENNPETGIEGLVSRTVPQRPDIFLQLTKDDIETGMKMTYLFDAKYRIDRRVDGVDTPPEDAINQMHRYRDAIYYTQEGENEDLKKEVIGGYILFPGAGNPEHLERARFIESINTVNIGAFPLRPNDTQNKAFLDNFIGGIIEKNARQILTHGNVIPQKGLRYDYSDNYEDEFVLIIYADPNKISLIQKNRLCYVKLGIQQDALYITPGYENVKYLILHNQQSRMMFTLNGLGPKIVSGMELNERGFDEKKEQWYLAYELANGFPIIPHGVNLKDISIRPPINSISTPYIVPLRSILSPVQTDNNT